MIDSPNSSTSPVNAISRAVGQIEVLCSRFLMLAFLCAVASVLLMPEVNWIGNRLHGGSRRWVLAAAAMALIAEVASFCLIARPVNHGKAASLLVLAETCPTSPLVPRPILFLWWLGHLSLAVLAGHVLTSKIQIFDRPTLYQRSVTIIIQSLFAIGISLSCNVYLMLMTASLTRSTPILRMTFRFRLIVDLLLCVDLLMPPGIFTK